MKYLSTIAIHFSGIIYEQVNRSVENIFGQNTLVMKRKYRYFVAQTVLLVSTRKVF